MGNARFSLCYWKMCASAFKQNDLTTYVCHLLSSAWVKDSILQHPECNTTGVEAEK